jgi:hypothetical protein
MKKKIQFETAMQAYIALVRSTERVHRSIAEYLEMISSMDLSKLTCRRCSPRRWQILPEDFRVSSKRTRGACRRCCGY